MVVYKRKTPHRISKEIDEFHCLRIQAYVEKFRDMLYEIWKSPTKLATKTDLEKLFADPDMYCDYVNMLRKKYMFMHAYHALKSNEALFVISGITRVFEDELTHDIRPYSYQTYIYKKGQTPTLLYAPHPPTYSKIKVMVEHETGYHTLELPALFMKRCISYLAQYDESSGDCTDFALHMLGLDGLSYNELIWPEPWDGNTSYLQIGDCISILPSTKSKSTHKAIYVGGDLFISKFGKSHLGISTLSQLHDIYKTTCATVNRYFRDTQSYADMKVETAKMLETHPDGERLKKVFANVGKGIS